MNAIEREILEKQLEKRVEKDMDKDERFFKEKMGEMLKSIEDGKEGVADELG